MIYSDNKDIWQIIIFYILSPTYLTKNGILYDWKDIIFFNKFMPGVITAVEWCSLVHRFRIQ